MIRTLNLTQSRIIRVAGICGILIPIVVFTCIGLAITQSPWFRWTQHALSNLGVEGISAAFFNSGMILSGILAFIFSLGLIKILSNKIGAYLLCLSSLALFGVGLFPVTVYIPHFIVSAAFFVLLPLSFLIIGLTIKQGRFERNMGVLAALFAMIAIASTIFLMLFEGIAIPESLSCFPAFIWCMVYGGKMAGVWKSSETGYKIIKRDKTPAIIGWWNR